MRRKFYLWRCDLRRKVSRRIRRVGICLAELVWPEQ